MMAIFAMAADLGATGVAAATLMGAGGRATGAAAAGTGAGVGFETASGSELLDAVLEPLHAHGNVHQADVMFRCKWRD